MKDYQKAMELLLATGTPSALANKWAKLASTTMDDELRGMAIEISRLFSSYIKPGRMRPSSQIYMRGIKIGDHYTYLEVYELVMTDAHKFVESRLAQGKPAWMIMAEKHGWGPLNR